MRASKAYGPCGGCGNIIHAGAEIIVVEGTMFHAGHETMDLLADQPVKRDYTQVTRPAREQKAITDLPLFGAPIDVEQGDLFSRPLLPKEITGDDPRAAEMFAFCNSVKALM